MCILLLAHRCHPVYDLVVAANRDEFHARASSVADFWPGVPSVIAGRDLEAGGTWLGISTAGQFAAVTNLRGGSAARDAVSRGHLVRDFLLQPARAADYIERLNALSARVAGCNLLVSDRDELYWWSTTARRKLVPGVYGISNSPWPDEWPKVQRLKAAYADLAAAPEEALIDGLFEVLRDRAPRPSGPVDLARLEETLFVLSPTYGTRCSTIVLRAHSGELCLVERSFDQAGDLTGERRFQVPRCSRRK